MPDTISNISDFLNAVKTRRLSSEANRFAFYRGHSKTTYTLEPSLFRNSNWREGEHLMLRYLLAENPKDFEGDMSAFDKLVRAQHYKLPTRLLDVTINPFVGLYFACCSNSTSDGKVLIVTSSKKRHKYFDSDVVSLLSNLAFLKRSEKDELLSYAREHVSNQSASSKRILAFENCPALDRLIQTVRSEKPYFRAKVDPYDLAYVVSVTPRKTNDRIRAQEGNFLVFGLNEKESGSHLEHLEISEILVPAAAKADILADLNAVGISERTLFPEIEKSAIQIRERYR